METAASRGVRTLSLTDHDTTEGLAEARLAAEPGGAVSFAAWLFRQEQLPPTRLNVALISAGNVDPSLLAQVLSESVSREAE